MRRQETTSEKLWRAVLSSRYRGVLLVACVPIVLILSVITFMPRTSDFEQSPVNLAPITNKGAIPTETFKYCIVFDAGSTGSRIHVYKFKVVGTGLELISDTFDQLKPGLSSYADDPSKAADSLKPLMARALDTVPAELQATTSVSLRATAGLRLLPGDKADRILEEVRVFLKVQPFMVKEDAVSILGGQDEGAYGWLTLNYLLGTLGTDISKTVAAIDLGGGSVQEAYAVSGADVSTAPKGYVSTMKYGATAYNVYVHSYLGYGLMAGRAKVIDSAAAGKASCFAKSYEGKYTYGGKDYSIAAAPEAASFDTCSTTVASSLKGGMDCGAPKDQCSFSGAWRGKGPGERAYYISSYFWDRAVESGIITDSAALDWKTTPKEFATKSGAACGTDDHSLARKFGDVKAEHVPYFCLDLSYCFTLLVKGFKLQEDQSITLVKQVKYNGQPIEAVWTLGAALNELA